MKRTLTFFICTFLFLTLLSAEKIKFSANSMTGKSGDSNTTTTLSGNAYIKTDSMEIQADYVELSGDDYRYIKASGSITGKNLDSNMEFKCNNLEYDRTTKVAELKGDVDLTDIDNDVKAKAQIIIYDQESEVAVLQVKINLTQDDNICTGSYAVYYKNEQILELSGNAQIKQKDDTFRAQHITLDMDTQDITLGGNVKGTVTDSKKDEPQEDNADENSENMQSEVISEEEQSSAKTDENSVDVDENSETEESEQTEQADLLEENGE